MGISIDIAELDATAQAELVQRREVTALELVDAAIANIEPLDGRLNAVIHRRYARSSTIPSSSTSSAASAPAATAAASEARANTTKNESSLGIDLLALVRNKRGAMRPPASTTSAGCSVSNWLSRGSLPLDFGLRCLQTLHRPHLAVHRCRRRQYLLKPCPGC